MALTLASDSLKRRVSKESRNDQTTTRLVDHLKFLEQKIKDTKLYLAQVVFLSQGQQT